MSDETIDPALQACGSSDAFDKLLEVRQVAQEAFVKLTSREAAAKTLRARPRLQRTFRAGDLVYVYRVLRRKKTVRGFDEAERGPRIGQKATWVGPGHVLALEGSVVWINMFGELWRASIEQTREATTVEKLGVEVVAEDFSEMQERLRRGSHKAGYRDITTEAKPEEDETEKKGEDEVQREGEDRGRPRARFEEQEDRDYSPSIDPGPDAQSISEDAEGDPEEVRQDGRRQSVVTVMEPEAELIEPNMQDVVDEQRSIDERASSVVEQDQVQSVADNQALDGIPHNYDAIRQQVQRRWQRRHDAPYFSEYFLVDEAEGGEEAEERTPKNDYWVYDVHLGRLQRHHFQWRKAKFNPSAAEGSPVPEGFEEGKKDEKSYRGRRS